jgi:hypothetical protein
MKNPYLEKSKENSITAENKKDKFDIEKFWRSENSSLSNIVNGRECEKPAENIRRNQIKCTIKKWIIWTIIENMKRTKFKWMRDGSIYIIDSDGQDQSWRSEWELDIKIIFHFIRCKILIGVEIRKISARSSPIYSFEY